MTIEELDKQGNCPDWLKAAKTKRADVDLAELGIINQNQ